MLTREELTFFKQMFNKYQLSLIDPCDRIVL